MKLRSRRAAPWVAIAAAGALSCSLAMEFDPEGKDCAGLERTCLSGYHCDSQNHCVAGDGPAEPLADGGVPADADGGT